MLLVFCEETSKSILNMEDVKEKTTTSLNSLIIINNDRYEGYKRGAEETDDGDLKALFTRLSMQSKGFSNELRKLIPFKDETPDRDETTVSGKFYRLWMDVKAALTAKNRKGILASCEFGEDFAVKTYKSVLDNPENISQEVLSLIRKQYNEIMAEHNTVRGLRDSA
jgi:uncharacterized protein (TIGR02284 family)